MGGYKVLYVIPLVNIQGVQLVHVCRVCEETTLLILQSEMDGSGELRG